MNIIKHQIVPKQDGYMVILYLDQNETEFANEFNTIQEKQSENLENDVQKYMNEKIPKKIIVKTVQIMIGTVIISTISLTGNHFNSTSAEASTINADQGASYIVKAGDTLFGIAKQYGMSVDQLKAVNNLSSDMLSIGQVLYITKTTVPSVTPSTTYRVVAGDSLYGIAKRYSITVDSLKSTNQLTSDVLSVGQVLSVPGGSSNLVTPTGPSTVPQTSTTIASYQVVSGDSLWGISKKFGVTVDAIQSGNNLTSDRLFVGQTLTIPTATTITPSSEGQTVSYTVKAGDSLSAIAKQYNTTVDALKHINQLSTDMILIGQVLIIPNGGLNVPQSTNMVVTLTPVQKQLQTLGYFVVPATTGSYESAAIQALKTFQSNYGLPTTGAEDTVTVTAIEHAIVKKGLVQDTNHYIGVPYVWGGETPSGFDCSGFVYYMFKEHGVDMVRTTSGNLYTKGAAIDRSRLQPGDLVFFGVNTPGVVSHVGFYAGNNQFVSATSSKGIQVVSLDNTYWSKYYIGAKRVY
ncbi:C40 family peptidase [Bacillus sp. 1NLA3E]|uniref:C40 family peptidase n=1 Tax=Bacillus sp. 1NLA3E TaxID=666686 RepID=UPI000247F185|nr:LysM peptidoglycan-binding domain-containing protein [Bacillus sp. 1NLA3E]AGK53921.1 cell wall hydrolase SleB [Bacillus sp. 1NLA3E]